jgi:hypothetical protein
MCIQFGAHRTTLEQAIREGNPTDRIAERRGLMRKPCESDDQLRRRVVEVGSTLDHLSVQGALLAVEAAGRHMIIPMEVAND